MGAAPILPLAWERPYAVAGVVLKSKKKKKKDGQVKWSGPSLFPYLLLLFAPSLLTVISDLSGQKQRREEECSATRSCVHSSLDLDECILVQQLLFFS